MLATPPSLPIHRLSEKEPEVGKLMNYRRERSSFTFVAVYFLDRLPTFSSMKIRSEFFSIGNFRHPQTQQTQSSKVFKGRILLAISLLIVVYLRDKEARGVSYCFL